MYFNDQEPVDHSKLQELSDSYVSALGTLTDAQKDLESFVHTEVIPLLNTDERDAAIEAIHSLPFSATKVEAMSHINYGNP